MEARKLCYLFTCYYLKNASEAVKLKLWLWINWLSLVFQYHHVPLFLKTSFLRQALKVFFIFRCSKNLQKKVQSIICLHLFTNDWLKIFLERLRDLQPHWQCFSCLLDEWIAKISKKRFWLFEIIYIIHFEMNMDRPDKSENIFGIWYQLST